MTNFSKVTRGVAATKPLAWAALFCAAACLQGCKSSWAEQTQRLQTITKQLETAALSVRGTPENRARMCRQADGTVEPPSASTASTAEVDAWNEQAVKYVKARNTCYVAAAQLTKSRSAELNADIVTAEREIRGTGKILQLICTNATAPVLTAAERKQKSAAAEPKRQQFFAQRKAAERKTRSADPKSSTYLRTKPFKFRSVTHGTACQPANGTTAEGQYN